MKKLLEYGQLLAFLVLAFWCFDLLKEKFKTKETSVSEEYKEKIKKALSSNSISTNQPTDVSKQTENKIEEEKAEPKIYTSRNRDPNLIGTWYEQKKYTSGGLNTETYLTFFEDGTLRFTNQSHGTLNLYDSDATIINEKEVDPQIQSMMDQGFRWFTDNGRICFSAPNGSLAGCDRTYSFDGQYLFIQLDGYKKPHAYTRSN